MEPDSSSMFAESELLRVREGLETDGFIAVPHEAMYTLLAAILAKIDDSDDSDEHISLVSVHGSEGLGIVLSVPEKTVSDVIARTEYAINAHRVCLIVDCRSGAQNWYVLPQDVDGSLGEYNLEIAFWGQVSEVHDELYSESDDIVSV